MGFAAFEFVTPIASSYQIFSRIATTSRARNDMVNDQRHTDESARCLTIFATMMGFGRDLFPKYARNPRHGYSTGSSSNAGTG